MPPEALTNKGNYDLQGIDIYATGVLLYTMVVGDYPFKRASKSNQAYRMFYEYPESWAD